MHIILASLVSRLLYYLTSRLLYYLTRIARLSHLAFRVSCICIIFLARLTYSSLVLSYIARHHASTSYHRITFTGVVLTLLVQHQN